MFIENTTKIARHDAECGCVILVYRDGSEPPEIEYCGSHSEAETLRAERDALREQNAELLAALLNIVQEAESYCEATGHKVEGAAMFGACDAICAAIPAARAAIAKATEGVS